MKSNLNPLVYVVMRNHNAYKLTSECLDSLLNMKYENFKIIVVDDGSKDNSADLIKKNYKNVLIIKSDKYIEYCKGLNLGIKKALKNRAHYIFVVNNDTKNFSQNYLDAIIDEFQKNKNLGMVGSLVYDYDKNKRNQGGSTIKRLGLTLNIPTEGYVIKSEVFKKIGYLDENLVRYFEDYDFLIRLNKVGYKTSCIKTISFDHLGGGTSKKKYFISNYYRLRNLIWFIKRYRGERSFMWKFKQFKGFSKIHIIRLIKSLINLRLKQFIIILYAILLALIVGILFKWRPNIAK